MNATLHPKAQLACDSGYDSQTASFPWHLTGFCSPGWFWAGEDEAEESMSMSIPGLTVAQFHFVSSLSRMYLLSYNKDTF